MDEREQRMLDVVRAAVLRRTKPEMIQRIGAALIASRTTEEASTDG